jgi:iron complex transport system substrate-binding protein
MAEPEKIVSLIPSATEILCALGAQHRLVGRSHECDHPPAVRALPALTRPRLRTGAASADIDREVRSLIEAALAVYDLDAEALRALAPDLIVTQSQCDVCAVSLDEVERAVAGWVGGLARVVSLQPNGLADVFDDIRRVAEALERPDAGETLVTEMQHRMAMTASHGQGRGVRPGVACIEWLDPLMAAGNWLPELVDMAGGRNLFGEAGRHSPYLDWDSLTAADPEVIVLMPCGFDIARTRAELPVLTGRPGWAALKAVRDHRVFIVDGNQYFNRPGPRLADSLDILAELLHPEVFAARYREIGWQPA